MSTRRTKARSKAKGQAPDQLLASKAMMNPVVLTNLFEVCDVDNLPEFRLVCKDWYSVSLIPCRNEMAVHIHQPTRYQQAQNPRDSHRSWLQWKTLKNQLDALTVGGTKPISNFRLLDVKFYSSPRGKIYKNMDLFWIKYGHNIRKLRLDAFSVLSVRAYKRMLFELTPNLEELRLTCLDTSARRNDTLKKKEEDASEEFVGTPNLNLKTFHIQIYDRLQLSWHDYFTHFPNIKDLRIVNYGHVANSLDSSLLDALEQLSETNKNGVIRQLDLSTRHHGTSDIVRRLISLPLLKLTELTLDDLELFDDEDAPERKVLPSAFLIHRTTLKKIYITTKVEFLDWYPYDSFPFSKETFPALTECCLDGGISWHLHFLEQMPNLKQLDVYNPHPHVFDFTDLKRLEKVRLPHLRQATFISPHVPEIMMEVLVKVMPNLERFSGPLLTPSFRLVCKHYSQSMKRMAITSGLDENERPINGCEGVIDDKGLTGIVDGCDEDKERPPNITDFKCLEFLVFQTTGKLGDASVRHGFLQVPSLKFLRTWLSPETSDEAFEDLERHLPAAAITRQMHHICERGSDGSSDWEDDTDTE